MLHPAPLCTLHTNILDLPTLYTSPFTGKKNRYHDVQTPVDEQGQGSSSPDGGVTASHGSVALEGRAQAQREAQSLLARSEKDYSFRSRLEPTTN
ncbi:hypothetical protein E2C01_026922 [Portunus trituberculatus]|uniref:Uncharacterized protein n=1 Tax=Portunus trituberculatus TaxID=210409 RepID=A0A5B7EJZ5_PORTR|nr:hypothetical protein [Portunus trituberculatus]